MIDSKGNRPIRVTSENPPSGVLAIVPARGGSKRLPKKNLVPVFGRPMLLLALEECSRSRYVDRIVVTTEDEEIKALCVDNGYEVVDRPAELAADDAPKMAAIVHAAEVLGVRVSYFPEIVVSLQPNNPEFKAEDLDSAIDFFREKVFPDQPIREVISLRPDLIQNGCFRIMTAATVFQRSLSSYVGAVITDYLDVHTAQDVEAVERRIRISLAP